MELREAIALIDSLIINQKGYGLTDLQKTIFSDCWLQPRITYEEIANNRGYSITYIKQDVGPKLWNIISKVCGEKVKKNSFKTAIERLSQRLISDEQNHNYNPQVFFTQPLLTQPPKTVFIEPRKIGKNCIFDLKEAPDIGVFFGRTEELKTLSQWLLNDGNNLLIIVGMGGIGKTSLSVKLAQEVKEKFDYVVWCSLAEAPSVSEIIFELLTSLSQKLTVDLIGDITEALNLLLSYLRHHRCLIILDNLETIIDIENGSLASSYRQIPQEYSQLFTLITERNHRSCFLLNSREKPEEIAIIEEKNSAVFSYRLSGLTNQASKQLLQSKGCYWKSELDCDFLITKYGGNPLALKIASRTIIDLFDRNIGEFITQKTFVFSGISNLLEQQVEQLSDISKTIIYWLAIAINPISIRHLKEYLIPQVFNHVLLDNLQQLIQYGFIEKHQEKFTLLGVLQEYLIERVIKIFYAEIIEENLFFLKTHSLLQPNNHEYIKEYQIEFIVKPLIVKCLENLGSKQKLESKLKNILAQLKHQNSQESGYAAGNILNILCKLDANLEGEDFSNLVIWQTDFQKTNLHKVNFSGSDLHGSVFSEKLTNILSLDFSVDGQILATGDSSGEIRLWSVQEKKLIRVYNKHTGWVFSLAFSPNGQLLASGSSDGSIILWNISQNRFLSKLQGHCQRVRCVVFSPCGQILASSSSDHTIKLWDVATGFCIRTLRGHRNYVWSLAFSPDGQSLASGSEDCTIKLWKIAHGECYQTLTGHQKWIRSVAFHPQDNILASGGGDLVVKLWDINRGECIQSIKGHTDRIRSIAFSSDGFIVASGSGDHTIKLWNYHTGQCIKTLHGHSSRLGAIAFSPNSQLLASGGEDCSVKLWNIQTGQCQTTWQGYASWIQSVAFSPDGKFLVSGSENRKIELWNLQYNRKCPPIALLGHQGWICQVAFCPYQKMIASCSSDYSIKLWDLETRKCFKTLCGHNRWIRSIAFSPDGKRLVSGGGDRTVRVWDIVRGNCYQTLTGHEGWIWSVAFSPDGITVASGSEDKTIRLWNIQTGKVEKILNQHSSWVQSVAFSPDGQTLASSSCDRTIKLWNINTGECYHTLVGHHSWVQSVAFSPDGQTLASGSCDRTIKLWNVNTGECEQTLQGHHSWVWSVAFSPNGQTLASGSQDESIKLWDLSTGNCYQTLRNKRLLEGAQISGVKGLTPVQIQTMKALGAVGSD